MKRLLSFAPMLLAPPRPLAEVMAALARSRPRCRLHATSLSDHVVQVYAGLHALARAGCVRLDVRRSPVDDLNGARVEVEGYGLVFFDVRDGPDSYPVASEARLYAKRSFHAASPPHAVPLGLNYAVHPRALSRLARFVPPLYRAVGMPEMGPEEAARLTPRALFLARTWQASEVNMPADELRALNDARAACIRALRKAFGSRFFGGFARSAHALREYSDCVVDGTTSTRRRDYLRLLRDFPVGIATTGLFGSTGWKFAEYVALSRAIACEPLRYALPGPIAAGTHYLEFTDADDCVAQVGRLLEDHDARAAMMQRNAEYWKEFGTPAAVVARVLHTALLRG